MMADDLIKTRISGDFTTHWIFDLYELGTAVSLIAHKVKLTEQRVYEKMRRNPETYEEVKKVREELYCRRLRRLFRKFLYKINRPSLDKSKIHATI